MEKNIEITDTTTSQDKEVGTQENTKTEAFKQEQPNIGQIAQKERARGQQTAVKELGFDNIENAKLHFEQQAKEIEQLKNQTEEIKNQFTEAQTKLEEEKTKNSLLSQGVQQEKLDLVYKATKNLTEEAEINEVINSFRNNTNTTTTQKQAEPQASTVSMADAYLAKFSVK